MKMKKYPTQKRLKELFTYDPETGHLIRLKKVSANTNIGDVVGSKTNGYLNVAVDSKRYLVHRIIFIYVTGKAPNEIDHINGIKDDNRWVNLRSVTKQENLQNQKRAKNNKSGYTGVHWSRLNKKWRAVIWAEGTQKHIGLYHDIREAIKARKAKEFEYNFHTNHGRTI